MNRLLSLCAISLLLSSCLSDPASESSGTDAAPISNPRYASEETAALCDSLARPLQVFTVDNTRDTLLVAENGTLVLIPAGVFVSKDGEAVNQVQIQLTEAYSLFDMLANGLSTVSENSVLQTDGMVYLNAQSVAGENVAIAADKQVYLEMPSMGDQRDMAQFQGVFSEKGDLNWTRRTPFANTLVTVPLNELNFYPEGFSPDPAKEFAAMPAVATNIYCGVSDELVKSMYDKLFAGTYVATREFEQRMPFIHGTCDEGILRIYLENVSGELWKADSLAYALLLKQNNSKPEIFKKFMDQRKSNVATGPVSNYAAFVNRVFADKAKKEQYQAADAVFSNPVAVSNLGWINCDRYLSDVGAVPVSLQLAVVGLPVGANVAAFLVFGSERALLPLIKDGSGFYLGARERSMKMPPGKSVSVVVIGRKEDALFLGVKPLVLQSEQDISVSVGQMTVEQVRGALSAFGPPVKQPLPNSRKSCCYVLGANEADDQFK
ncbi:MAG: hypothetical protein V4616_01595 [Bacteroidota bacterium]